MNENWLKKEINLIDEFYEKIDNILGIQLPGQTIGHGRWRRGAGRGRYKNIGLIRYYSENNIHVMFHTPPLNKVYTSSNDAINGIQKLFKFD